VVFLLNTGRFGGRRDYANLPLTSVSLEHIENENCEAVPDMTAYTNVVKGGKDKDGHNVVRRMLSRAEPVLGRVDFPAKARQLALKPMLAQKVRRCDTHEACTSLHM
jgi:hypothetical protein